MFICICCKEEFEEIEMVDDYFCFECSVSDEVDNCENCDCLTLKSDLKDDLCTECRSMPYDNFMGVYRR